MVGKIVNDQVQNVTDDEIDVYVDSARDRRSLAFHRVANINWRLLPVLQELWIILLLSLRQMVRV